MVEAFKQVSIFEDAEIMSNKLKFNYENDLMIMKMMSLELIHNKI
jgi:hypothetical protein